MKPVVTSFTLPVRLGCRRAAAQLALINRRHLKRLGQSILPTDLMTRVHSGTLVTFSGQGVVLTAPPPPRQKKKKDPINDSFILQLEASLYGGMHVLESESPKKIISAVREKL